MIDNNLLTIFLNFHDVLASFKSLRNEGKLIGNKICDLLTEREILQKSPNKVGLSSNHEFLYTYAIDQISKRIAEETVLFECSYLQKLVKINQNSWYQGALLKNLNKYWAKQNQIKLGQMAQTQIFDLVCMNQVKNNQNLGQIFNNLAKAQKEQIQLIKNKWEHIQTGLFAGQNVSEQIKILVLHISFETYIEDSLLKYWDEGITGLQSKRYK